MNRITDDPKCPKCGSGQIGMCYFYSHTYGNINEYEYLQLECIRCKYCWKVLPLDAKESEEK